MAAPKQFLYVGYYIDKENRFMLKIGTTNNLERRQKEHTRNYRNASRFRMPIDKEFQYILSIPLSKYNTLRYEDVNRTRWIEQDFGVFVANDRFWVLDFPKDLTIKIRKEYKIDLSKVNFLL